VPLSDTICGLEASLSENERLPEVCPAGLGVKLMATAQLAPAATVPGAAQVVPGATMAKGPLAVIAEIDRPTVPELVSVTV
jgi:hypothetical protein